MILASTTPFSRASIAYSADANGRLKVAAINVPRLGHVSPRRTNYIRYSNNPGFTGVNQWARAGTGTGSAPIVTPNFATAPDGTLTANRIQLNQGAGVTAADTSTVQASYGPEGFGAHLGQARVNSVWLKTNDGSTVNIYVKSMNGNAVTISVTPGWQLFSLPGICVAGSSLLIGLRGTISTALAADILMWQAQFEEGLIATERINTTSTEVTVGGVGSLYEPVPATNLFAFPNDFDNAYWTKQANVSVAPNAADAPDGTTTADRIDWLSAAVNTGILRGGIAVSAVAANCKSIYVRADVAGGTIALADPSNTIGTRIITLTASWQRVWLSESQPGALAGLWIRKQANSPASIYLWASMLENNAAEPSSFTLTTRSADIESVFLSATPTGFNRQLGSFVTDGFAAGQEITPVNFAKSDIKRISGVTASDITVEGGAWADPVQIGRSLVAVAASVPDATPTPRLPIDLRQDTVTGVYFDANDPTQLAAHPNSKVATVGKGDTTKRKQYVIKNPTEIAGRIVREDLH